MPRKAAKISPEELWNLFQEKAKAAAVKEGDWEEGDRLDPFSWQSVGKISADLQKVEFDFENCEFQHQEEFGQWEGMLGYRTLYPLSYIGVMAGGDWEYPIYFIIYLDQDGKTFRAYIPKDGNVWNYDTKTAFGNDDEADDAFLRKWIKTHLSAEDAKTVLDQELYANEHCDIMFNKELIRADIQKRIEVADG